MDNKEIANLLLQPGAFGVLMLILWRIGNALIAALKDLRTEIAEHTKKDLAAMAEVREDLAAIASRVDTLADVTPIRGVRQHPRPASAPGAGYYPPRKPPREDG